MSETTTETTDEVLEAFQAIGESFSPYQMSKAISVLAGRYVREQMLYSYCNKGYIKASKVSGKWVVTAEDAAEWTKKYLAKKA
jgi:hypothetical protein